MVGSGSDALWVLLPTAQQRSGAWIDDTLKERVQEHGLLAKTPLVGQFPRQRVEVFRGADAAATVNTLFYQRGWTDGLPIVPPTLGKVEAMLAATTLAKETVLAELDPLKGQATLEKLAINAVMAGCLPAYLPILIEAVQALAQPEFNLRGVQTTDENVAPLLILNGPIVDALDINSSFGALGPGWQANATIGRAVRLIMHNIGGGWPGAVSFAGLGHAGRYTLCFAENERESPWDPLHVDLGFNVTDSTITLMRAESAVNVTGGLPEIASVIGSAASYFAMMHEGKVAVALAPYVAQTLAKQGWSKTDVSQHLYEKGRIPASALTESWLFSSTFPPDQWPTWLQQAASTGSVPAVREASDIIVIVAGGTIPIPQHVYFPSWGFPACCIPRRIMS